MKKYVYIGIGGFVGAIARVLIKSIPISGYRELNTLIINILGCFLLALILTAAVEVWEIGPDVRIGVAVGLLGAFTTFSTLCKEMVGLLQGGRYMLAFLYAAASLLLGFAAVYLGRALSHEIWGGLLYRKEKKESFRMENQDETESGVK